MNIRIFFIAILISSFFSSCFKGIDVQKRKYTRGFYISGNRSKKTNADKTDHLVQKNATPVIDAVKPAQENIVAKTEQVNEPYTEPDLEQAATIKPETPEKNYHPQSGYNQKQPVINHFKNHKVQPHFKNNNRMSSKSSAGITILKLILFSFIVLALTAFTFFLIFVFAYGGATWKGIFTIIGVYIVLLILITLAFWS